MAGRVPVAIHVSALAVEDSLELARHAQSIGADCVVAITPYFWNPSPQAIFDYFVRLGTSIDLPLLAYNSPGYLSGVEITGDLLARLIERLPNLIGVKEASFNSEKFLELSRVGARDAARFRDDRGRRIPPPVDSAGREGFLLVGRRHLSEPRASDSTSPARRGDGPRRASASTRSRGSG